MNFNKILKREIINENKPRKSDVTKGNGRAPKGEYFERGVFFEKYC